MAVYTNVERAALEDYLSRYDIGALESYEGIAPGVSNSNFMMETDKGRYVLTLFEPHRVKEDDIPFFMNYVVCLQNHGVACPEVMMMKDGSITGMLCNRPAAIFSFLPGEVGAVASVGPARCRAAGALLAQMHEAAGNYKEEAPNKFGPARWRLWVDELERHRDKLGSVMERWPGDLPRGAIHGDYFPDNVFFEGDQATGVIDFHFVGTDFYAYDLAIALVSWCFDSNNRLDPARFKAFMDGYESIRPLSEGERAAMPVLLQGACLRFLLSRLEEEKHWRPDMVGKPHDPNVFLKRLEHFSS